MNGINKIVDLFKLLNDRILIDPSENITNTKPNIKNNTFKFYRIILVFRLYDQTTRNKSYNNYV